MNHAIVLTAFQEDIVLRCTLDGKVTKQRSRRILQAAIGIAIRRETRRELQLAIRRRIAGGNETDGLGIGFVWSARSLAEDIVPIMSVLVGSDSLKALPRHVVLSVVDVEGAFDGLCLSTQHACKQSEYQQCVIRFHWFEKIVSC